MSTKDLTQAGDAVSASSTNNELNANPEMVTWTKSFALGFACVVGCIVVFGAVDLYWFSAWEYINYIVTRGGTSLWSPCILGLISSAVGCWAIGSPVSSKSVWKYGVVVVLSVGVWAIAFTAASLLVFNAKFPELEGFIRWAYLALYLPIIATVIRLLVML